jgi:hypothetical protein
MAISITWGTKVINVPKADLTLIQASPEVRELDLDWFRLQLKDLEDDPEGMPFVDTHRHNTEVTLSGLTYARIVEIINGYTVEFEDGQYTVNCVGANHNISDVKVANQVSLIVNNAAGLITNNAIEYSSFNGGVTIDVTSAFSGTLFPVGTPQAPVNNMTDALLIAGYRGLTTFYVIGDLDITAALDLEGYVFVGESMTKSEIDIDSAAACSKCEFYDASVVGTLDGENKLQNCRITNLNYLNGVVEQCLLGPGTITLGGSATAHFLDCWSGVPGTSTPVIDMGGAGQSLALRNYNGGISLRNKSGSDAISIDLNSGQVILESTLTAGDIVVRGIGKLTDLSQGANVLSEDFISPENIATHVWSDERGDLVFNVEAGRWKLESNQMIFYEDDNLTEIARFDLFDSGGSPTMENVYERRRVVDDSWKYPFSMMLNIGSISSGALTDVQADDANLLELNEITGSPGFDYVFLFTKVKTSNIEIWLKGYYEGNPAHNVKAKVMNWTTYEWDDLTGDAGDFPSRSDEAQYSFSLTTDSYVSSEGHLAFCVVHESNGSAGHYFRINELKLVEV